MRFWHDYGKPAFDFVSALVLLLLLWPVILLVGLAVRIWLGPPVLFRQERHGLRGRKITVLKFRTMEEIHDELGVPLPDPERSTPFGLFLRSTSLDELPQLINVLRGEMSLIGPRPLLDRHLPHGVPELFHRDQVRPGITGWAQVNGRNAITMTEKFKLDVLYVDRVSLALDLRIFVLTVFHVLKRTGITEDSSPTPVVTTTKETITPQNDASWDLDVE